MAGNNQLAGPSNNAGGAGAGGGKGPGGGGGAGPSGGGGAGGKGKRKADEAELEAMDEEERRAMYLQRREEVISRLQSERANAEEQARFAALEEARLVEKIEELERLDAENPRFAEELAGVVPEINYLRDETEEGSVEDELNDETGSDREEQGAKGASQCGFRNITNQEILFYSLRSLPAGTNSVHPASRRKNNRGESM